MISMTTSIKINDSTKSKIEKLQAQLYLETGKKLSQQQLLELLADWSVNNLSQVKNLLLDVPIVLTDEEIAAYENCRVFTGVKTDPAKIDDILYGED